MSIKNFEVNRNVEKAMMNMEKNGLSKKVKIGIALFVGPYILFLIWVLLRVTGAI